VGTRFFLRAAGRVWPVALAVAVLASTSCTEQTIVFRDRPLFNPPPDASTGFLGYSNAADGQTTCGNCHTGIQASWENTAHARAWEDLQASGGAQDFCAGCHAVSELGNAVDTTAGYNAVPDSAYHDVQCESCHGPGLDHVENTDGVRPLASVVVDTALANGCGECHSGTHNPFVEQWRESAHGSGETFAQRGGIGSCASCHNPRVTMEVSFGEANTVYAEQDTLEVWPAMYCVTCHDPHGSPYDAQLRAPIDVPSRDNLCVTCHARRGQPPGGKYGPHAAQGLLVLGDNVGWIPPNFAYDSTLIASSHGTDANARLCASCHVSAFEVTDAATGDFLLSSVGHTFEAIQCLDAQGLPTDGPCTDTERTFSACATSGCHATESAALTAFQSLKTRINLLLDILWTDDGNDTLDATDGGLIPRVIAADIAAGDTGSLSQLWLGDQTVSVAEGAFFNAQLAFTHDREYWGDGYLWGEHFGAGKASGEGVHNPFLLEALLLSSIQAVLNEYTLTPTAGMDLNARLTQPPSVRRLR